MGVVHGLDPDHCFVQHPARFPSRTTTVAGIKEDISPTSSYGKIIKSIIILSS